MLKTVASSLAAVALTFGLVTTAGAATTDYLTRFTFNQPFSIPGVTLPAGTYTFKLANPNGDRKIVQVMDERGMESFALLQAIPAYRNDNVGDPALSLMDTVSGVPAAIKTWWPLGQSAGFEFIYPEVQHARLTGILPLPGIPEERAAFDAVPVSRTTTPVAAAEPVMAMQVLPAAPESFGDEAVPGRGSSRAIIALLGALTLFAGAWALGRARV